MKKRILHLRGGKVIDPEAGGDIRDLFKIERVSDELVIKGIGGDVYGFGSDPRSFKRNGMTMKCSECLGILVSHPGVLSIYSPTEIEISISPDGDVFEIKPWDAQLLLSFSKGSLESVSEVLRASSRRYFRPRSVLELINGSLSGFVPQRIRILPDELMPFWKAHVEEIAKSGCLAFDPVFKLDSRDEISRNVWDQFLIGGVMIAPVVKGTDGRTLYIPRGTWRDPKTGEVLTPGLRFFESDETITLLGEDSLLYEISRDGIEIFVNLVNRISERISYRGIWRLEIGDGLIRVKRDGGVGRTVHFHIKVWSESVLNEISFTARDFREVRLN